MAHERAFDKSLTTEYNKGKQDYEVKKIKMLLINKTIQKFTSSLLIISILAPTILFSFKPERAEAQGEVPVADFQARLSLKTIAANTPVITAKTTLSALLEGKSWAQKLLELALMAVARAVLARITQATINWINSDFHGAPLYLQNPSSFFGDIAKSQIKNIVSMIGYDQIGFPFGQQTALNIIDSYKNQLAINARYSLSKISQDTSLLASFRNDFRVGGWNGFLLNTQYPQNNYLGFQMEVGAHLSTNLEGVFQAPAQKIESLLQQGMGFLSPQACPSNPSYNNGTNEFVKPTYQPTPYNGTSNADYAAWKTQNDANRTTWAATNECPGGLVNTTPGSVAANQIMMANDLAI